MNQNLLCAVFLLFVCTMGWDAPPHDIHSRKIKNLQLYIGEQKLFYRMTDLEKQLLDYTSLRYAEGRAFCAALRRLRECVYLFWEHWPTAEYPPVRPPKPCDLLEVIVSFPLHDNQEAGIQLLPWCKESWSQIETVTRHLALHIDSVLEAYYPAARPHVSQKDTTFAERILVMQRLQLLRDYVSQLYWWLNALFGA
jgi:hypothetical protein